MSAPEDGSSAFDHLLSALEKIAAARARELAVLNATKAAILEANERGWGVVVDLRPGSDPIAWATQWSAPGTVVVLPADREPMASWDSPAPVRYPPASHPGAAALLAGVLIQQPIVPLLGGTT